jgi:single-strand DNA-binding protein
LSINRCIISGNLTRSPELKQTQGGTAVLQMGVAVNDRRKNPSTGEWEDVANFVDCVLFGTRAERVAQYLDKGTKVAIEGRLRYRAWEQDGARRSKLEVVVDEIEFMSRANNGQQVAQSYPQPAYVTPTVPAPAYAPAPQRPAPPRPQAPQQQTAMAMDYYDEDVPF